MTWRRSPDWLTCTLTARDDRLLYGPRCRCLPGWSLSCAFMGTRSSVTVCCLRCASQIGLVKQRVPRAVAKKLASDMFAVANRTGQGISSEQFVDWARAHVVGQSLIKSMEAVRCGLDDVHEHRSRTNACVADDKYGGTSAGSSCGRKGTDPWGHYAATW